MPEPTQPDTIEPDDATTCPRCGGTSANVHGLPDCPACSWTGSIEDR